MIGIGIQRLCCLGVLDSDFRDFGFRIIDQIEIVIIQNLRQGIQRGDIFKSHGHVGLIALAQHARIKMNIDVRQARQIFYGVDQPGIFHHDQRHDFEDVGRGADFRWPGRKIGDRRGGGNTGCH